MIKIVEKEVLNVDIFYSNQDITSLRWLSEIEYEMTKQRTSLIFRIHELSSDYAKSMNIFSELIIFNNNKINLDQLKKIIKIHCINE